MRWLVRASRPSWACWRGPWVPSSGSTRIHLRRVGAKRPRISSCRVSRVNAIHRWSNSWPILTRSTASTRRCMCTWSHGTSVPLRPRYPLAPMSQLLDLNDQIIQFDGVPDLFVIGLQEMVELNPKNVVGFSQERAILLWNQAVSTALAKYGDFVRIEIQSLVGLYLAVFANKTIVRRIGSLETDILKTGFQGTLGNKGALLVRFKIDDTDVIVVSSIWSLCSATVTCQQAKPKWSSVFRSSSSSMNGHSLMPGQLPNQVEKRGRKWWTLTIRCSSGTWTSDWICHSNRQCS